MKYIIYCTHCILISHISTVVRILGLFLISHQLNSILTYCFLLLDTFFIPGNVLSGCFQVKSLYTCIILVYSLNPYNFILKDYHGLRMNLDQFLSVEVSLRCGNYISSSTKKNKKVLFVVKMFWFSTVRLNLKKTLNFLRGIVSHL